MTTTVHPSGEQFEIGHGDQHATVVEVGGGIRSYTRSGRDVLQPYPVDALCDGAHGTPLVPWPNRLADGRYSFDGADYRVALTEPAKRNAIHGFLRWRPWRALVHEADRVVMAVRLLPLTGYPFLLDVAVDYRLSAGGLTVTTTATNAGDRSLPYGSGQHPYLSPGPEGTIDEATLRFDAATRITTDPDRQLPTGTEAVAGTPFDFREPRRLGDTAIDFAFTDLPRDDDGRAWVRLTGADGLTAALWVDRAYPLVELYTADTLAPSRRRRGLGVEPMTCPPNALATGQGIIRLEAGETTTSTWGALVSAPSEEAE
ncbi:aldose 1-epimerase family protein [Pseudactinotalea sp. HY158]|uniref:aldose 1-epimerase family protein n=1 Tax=Pseudactinotalea sp. HY158 TaxID=2654547 RepID=UPI00129C3609|nr:aldose 1-epimerase family protein [Pseudactinotalea sp. HY158]QGH68751.1 aldose epimerase [Pseudactinotalea sp. HY158]